MTTRRKKKKGLTVAEKEARLDFAQEVYTRTLSSAKTVNALAAQFGITTRHARNVMLDLRQRWREEAELEGHIEDRRNEMRETGRAAFERAMRRRVAQHNSDGTPAFYPKGHPRAGQLVTREDPDLQHALRAIEFLAKLDGLLVHNLKLEGDGPHGLVEAISALSAADDAATLH